MLRSILLHKVRDKPCLHFIHRHEVHDLHLLSYILLLELRNFHLEALRLQGVERNLLGQCMQVNLLFGIVAGSRFFGYGSRSGSVPGGARRGALLGSITLGSGAEVFLEASSLGGDRLRCSTFGLLALDVGFR